MKKAIKNKKSAKPKKSAAAKKRPLHLRISLHPVSIFFLLCVGVYMVVNTYKVFGVSTQLTMNITAVPLVSPAVINSPKNNDRFDSPDISVYGTCPSESYVKIYKNGSFNGVSPCQDGKFEFMITLAAGANELRVRVFNFSDQEGPASDSITVYYDLPPEKKSEASPAPKMPAKQIDQLRIISDYKYEVFPSGKPVNINLALAGGTNPYAVAIDWNDGKISPVARADTSSFIVSHTYSQQKRLYTYVIKVAASDTHGNTDFIQLKAVIASDTPENKTGISAVSPDKGDSGHLQTLLKYMWPAYLIVLLMVLSFYLGEREEKRILTRKKQNTMFR